MTSDLSRAARLLVVERDALFPLLRALDDTEFDRSTVLPGWSVRDVLAHSSALLKMAAMGTISSTTPEENELDVLARRDWPVAELLDELASGFDGAVQAIQEAGGALDSYALTVWLHGGDVREAIGHPEAYVSEGVDDALKLIAERSRDERWRIPATHVRLTDRGADLNLGTGEVTAKVAGDTPSFVRLIGGRLPDPTRITISGAEPPDFVMFG